MDLQEGDVFDGNLSVARELYETSMSHIFLMQPTNPIPDGKVPENVILKLSKFDDESTFSEEEQTLATLGTEELKKMADDLSTQIEELSHSMGASSSFDDFRRMGLLMNEQEKVMNAIRIILHKLLLVTFETEAEVSITMGERFPNQFPHIIKIIRKTNGDIMAIIMEYIKGGDLSDYMEKLERPLNEEEIAQIAISILSALEKLHACGVIYRDLKPENVLLDNDSNGEIETIKLTDFGLAKTMRSEKSMPPRFKCGTPNYMAPECLSSDKIIYDRLTDLYAFGVLLYYMCESRRTPFGGKRQPRVPGEQMREMNDASPFFRGLISELLSENPKDRPQQPRNIMQKIAQYIVSKQPELRAQEPYYSALGRVS
ncbi:MAG: serine/threonine-protein kinase [Candidatus Gracilibacteria bacterium]